MAEQPGSYSGIHSSMDRYVDDADHKAGSKVREKWENMVH